MNKRTELFKYALKRLLQGIPLIVAVIILCFILIQLAPGDPVTVMSAGFTPSDETRAQLEASWGLDQPIHIQLIRYFTRILHGDFGNSYFQGAPVLDIICERIPATLLLMFTGIILSSIVGIIGGVICAKYLHKPIDNVISSVALVGYSVPLFWVGQVLILIFAVKLKCMPVSGMENIRESFEGLDRVLDIGKHLILPGLSLSFWFTALMLRITRTKMAEVLQSDFIKTAYAKGLPERRIIIGHALRNSLSSIVTVFGIEFSVTFMGAVVIETVFGWPGTGKLLFDSVMNRDYPVITGMFCLIAVTVIVVNVIVDIIYALLDARIRYES